MQFSNIGGLFVRNLAIGVASAALIWSSTAVAQDSSSTPEDDESYDVIVVTGSVRQGGAQDINHFREASFDSDALPRLDSFTMEGLLGEHDLELPAAAKCAAHFCLTGEAMTAALPMRPDDRYFVGLGFASNVDAARLQRTPLSLIAVIDRSGSMSGEPIDNVKAGLRQLVSEMRDGDRLAIVLYGTTSLVHLNATDVRGNRDQLLASINAIKIDGSTNMEEGLAIGYAEARKEAQSFKGKTRVMLFTDEQPNVGATDANSFMGMAQNASLQGIGLTTIGAGVQYDGALASKISSVRGGNLFFIANRKQATDLFSAEFRNMVSEVAHDVTITMTPDKGYKIAGVFGVPANIMQEGKDGSVEVMIPTAFLSSNGGGIFVSLANANGRAFLPSASTGNAPLLTTSMRYTNALDGKTGEASMTVAAVSSQPHQRLRLAHMLVDEYVTLQKALSAYHKQGDRRGSYAMIDGLRQRIASAAIPDLKKEQELVDGLHKKSAYLAGFSGELPKGMRHMGVLGDWQVLRVVGLEDIYSGDRVNFSDDQTMTTHFRKKRKGETSIEQDFAINDKEILLREERLKFDYTLKGERLTLATRDGLGVVELRKLASTGS